MITLKERILTKPIILQDVTAVIPKRELAPDIILEQKAITVIERVLNEAVKISGHEYLSCPADFGFTNLCPCLFKIGLSTYIRFSWETAYNMAEANVYYKQIPRGTALYCGPLPTVGTNHSMDTLSTVGGGQYEYRVSNKNNCGDWDATIDHHFEIIDTPGGLEMSITD